MFTFVEMLICEVSSLVVVLEREMGILMSF